MKGNWQVWPAVVVQSTQGTGTVVLGAAVDSEEKKISKMFLLVERIHSSILVRIIWLFESSHSQ